MAERLIQPNWPAPNNIRAFITTRVGGVSLPPYDSLNMGDHVEDSPENVTHNRQILLTAAQCPSMPLWLKQTHSTTVTNSQNWRQNIEADAIISAEKNQVCVVMTADCLPVLICNRAGSEVAAIHAGWRGLCDGIIEKTVASLAGRTEDYMAWLGPAIGPTEFEVGDEVREAFIAVSAEAVSAFKAAKPGHFLADIYALARQRLNACGIQTIYGGNYCTVSQPDLFFSYRRDGVTGRMASLIWLTAE